MSASGLDPREAGEVAAQFGVGVEQVRRDHLISHVLSALRRFHRDDVIFFGGTALSRTYLPAGQLGVRVQLLNSAGQQPWPTLILPLEQRYRDAPSATMRVPTIEAFAAWKTAAWLDRHAARDLYDLWALAERGGINPHAVSLFIAHGPTGLPPQPWMFNEALTDAQWHEDLSNQTKLTVSASDALRVVARAWTNARTTA